MAWKRRPRRQASLVVIRLDTPGGLVTSMRQMVKAILACPVPVVVYVSPAGARATSAGAFLMLAAPVAAMAPATHVGAAHPVGGQGQDIKGTMGEKAVSDLKALAVSLAKRRGRDPKLAEQMVVKSTSFDALKAKELGLADMVARDLGDLLQALQGRKVSTVADGEKVIDTKGQTIRFHQPGWREKLLSLLASPNLAYILLMIGLAGLYFELSHPGAIFPGVVGGLALILAFFAMSTLPVSYAGLALIGLAVVLFFAEIKITSYGMLSLAGAASLILGSVMLFKSGERVVAVSLTVLVPHRPGHDFVFRRGGLCGRQGPTGQVGHRPGGPAGFGRGGGGRRAGAPVGRAVALHQRPAPGAGAKGRSDRGQGPGGRGAAPAAQRAQGLARIRAKRRQG